MVTLIKTLLTLLLLCISLQADTITLICDYPTEELSPDLTFKLYHSSAITNPLPWTVMTNFVGTTTMFKVDVRPGQHYFYLTASNYFYGESLPSEICATNIPFIPRSNIVLKATRP